jgi:hypothetical protein
MDDAETGFPYYSLDINNYVDNKYKAEREARKVYEDKARAVGNVEAILIEYRKVQDMLSFLVNAVGYNHGGTISINEGMGNREFRVSDLSIFYKVLFEGYTKSAKELEARLKEHGIEFK